VTVSPRSSSYEAREVIKDYPGTRALRGVSFGVDRGEVHALIGENGAGKSTLVKILAGVEAPTTGALLLDGAPVTFASVRAASAAGIGIIHQELQLFPDLSVAENLFIGRERLTKWGGVDHQAQEREARAAVARLGHDVDPRTPVGALPLGIRQIVEIARALVAEARVLMMDEPTSALAPAEVQALFRAIRDLAAHGVGIVYISHHLDEVLAIADRVTVLRDGTVVGSATSTDVDVSWIVERMTGRPAGERRTRPARGDGAVVLDAQDLCLPPQSGRTALDRVSVRLVAGEVVGVYGLLGAGRTELFETLVGMHPDARGHVLLDGTPVDRTAVAGRIAAGIAMVPEDRQSSGLVPSLTVQQNMTLAHLAALAPQGVLTAKAEREASSVLAAKLCIKTPSLDAPVTALSGGNQQKVVIARGVMTRPRVLLLDDPTRGVDIAAKAEIHATMRALAAEGMAVAFASSDLAEIIDAADRVVVMARGRVTAALAGADVTESALTGAASSGLTTRHERHDDGR